MKTRCLLAAMTIAPLLACGGGTSTGSGSGGVLGSGGDGSGGDVGPGGNATASGSGGGGLSATGAGAAGVIATGGSHSGGTTCSGGTTKNGGSIGSGGIARRGGTSGSGGASGKGGAAGRGGSTGKGGNAGSGSTTARGGSSGSGGATGGTACTRELLQAAVDSYLAAMQAGDASGMSLAGTATYTENGSKSQFGQGLWASGLAAPDLHMSLLDVDKCGSYTEVIVASGRHPYVLGVRLTVSKGQISAVNVIATDCDDWGFNASSYLRYAKAEQSNVSPGSGWGPVPPDDQFSRAELQAAGDAYFEYWADKTVSVPWGYPCSRLEGGMATNPDPNPNRTSTCNVGIPNQSYAPRANDYLVDVDYGMVVLFLNLPGPDSHWFRITKSSLMRYIHTLTVCYVDGVWQCPGPAPTCS